MSFGAPAPLDFEVAVKGTDPDALHHFDAKRCPKCGLRHDLALEGEEIPPGIAAGLSELLDQMPKDVVSAAVIAVKDHESELAQSFSHFATIVTSLNTSGPILAAVAEVLDEQTNGRISAKVRRYSAESRVIMIFSLQKILNNFFAELQSQAPKAPESLMHAVGNMMAKLVEHRRVAIETYEAACEGIGEAPDPRVIEVGLVSEDRPFAELALVTALRQELAVGASVGLLGVIHHHYHDQDHEED